jgi:hypothetical protein
MPKNYQLLARIVVKGHNIGSFAASVGLSVRTLSCIVNQRHRPRPATLELLCSRLGASPEELGLQVYRPETAFKRNQAGAKPGSTSKRGEANEG